MTKLLACLLLTGAALLGGTARAEPALVAHDFKLPKPLVSERFVLRPLQLRDSALDHEVIAGSVRHLDQDVYPGGQWAAAMTPERAQVEAGYYQRQFEMARGFAYLILDPAQQRALGRVYVWSAEKRGYDAMMNYFVRESELGSGLAGEVDRAVRDWLAREWPFKRVLFYRDLGSAGYRALPDKQWIESQAEAPAASRP
ncbi:GNAT family N-acetyltransferase [Paucibacter sp. XJ19-41]|uniref:GNAT family N-acetyltransferase n=1 Tax=Paucibacter sp. XJ19-41 TaxID=2927824 RepID=UPI00234AFAAF|nr:GNAT family N-acetyltransferase [Paucibacter sp. XJ19-41]MDC6166805.1 GNAT family N-acetyltransferase [Paucibacter sp. XJ19-41]